MRLLTAAVLAAQTPILRLQRTSAGERLIVGYAEVLLEQFPHPINGARLSVPHLVAKANELVVAPVHSSHAPIQRLKELIMVVTKDYEVDPVERLSGLRMLKYSDGCLLLRP